MADSPAWRAADADAEAAGVRAAVALFFDHHPYRALHEAIPVLLSARHPAARRFAWELVEGFVERLERHPLPEPRHVASFGRIFRRYRGDAAALGDAEAAALFDRALAGAHVHDPAGPPPAGLSVFMVAATVEASEFAHAQRLSGRMLRGEDYLDDALAFVASTPVPEARVAGLGMVAAYVVRLEAVGAALMPAARRREERALLARWRAELAADPEASALLVRALSALGSAP